MSEGGSLASLAVKPIAPFARDDFHEERRPYTSKTPRTRLWKVRFFGDDDDDFEEYNADELAKHLSRAHDEGARGPAPEAGSEQLTALPEAHAAAAAEEEDEGGD